MTVGSPGAAIAPREPSWTKVNKERRVLGVCRRPGPHQRPGHSLRPPLTTELGLAEVGEEVVSVGAGWFARVPHFAGRWQGI